MIPCLPDIQLLYSLNNMSSVLLRFVFLLHPVCYCHIVFSPGLLQHPSSGPPCFQAYPSAAHYLSYCPEIQNWFHYSPAFFFFFKSSKVPAHLSNFIFITLFIHKCIHQSIHPPICQQVFIECVLCFGCWLGDLAYSGEQTDPANGPVLVERSVQRDRLNTENSHADDAVIKYGKLEWDLFKKKKSKELLKDMLLPGFFTHLFRRSSILEKQTYTDMKSSSSRYPHYYWGWLAWVNY